MLSEQHDKLPEFALARQYAEELRRGGVSNECVSHWGSQEMEVWNERRLLSRSAHLRPDTREAVLRFMEVLARQTGLSTNAFHVAALLWDLVCEGGFFAESLSDLPAAAAAMVRLMLKDEGSRVTAPSAHEFADHTSKFARWLGSRATLGIVAQDGAEEHSSDDNDDSIHRVSAEQVVNQEMILLGVLGWRVHRPSGLCWVHLLCERLDIISGREFSASLHWIYQQGLFALHALIMRSPHSSEMRPRQLANGIFCLFLVAARVVPLAVLRTPEVSPSEWESLFLETRLTPGGTPTCEVPAEKLPAVLKSLIAATASTAVALQADALAVARVMRGAVAELTSGEHELRHRQQIQDLEERRQSHLRTYAQI